MSVSRGLQAPVSSDFAFIIEFVFLLKVQARNREITDPHMN